MSHFGERIANLASESERTRTDLNRLRREVTLLSRSAGALTKLGERTSSLERDLQEEAAGHATR